jgi:osmotically-inducible protein OsmY
MNRAIPIAAAVAAGAAGEYFLDPQHGKRRRHVARDRGMALIRRPARRFAGEAQRRAADAEGVAEGVVHAATRGGGRDPERLNDAGLAAKVQSEVFRDPDAPKDHVSVNVEDGVVYLRGELPNQNEIESLVADVQAVDGVGEVNSLLHVPGEPAPARA